MLTIDGAAGEGGGQILRTALALSIVTGTPFRIERIRARRARPGLLRQHLTAVNAVAEVSGASVTGAERGSATLTFAPGRVRPAISNSESGTRGALLWSCKPLCPPCSSARWSRESRLKAACTIPRRPRSTSSKNRSYRSSTGWVPRSRPVRPGFYPAGGGRIEVKITPAERLMPIDMMIRGSIREVRGRAIVANLRARSPSASLPRSRESCRTRRPRSQSRKSAIRPAPVTSRGSRWSPRTIPKSSPASERSVFAPSRWRVARPPRRATISNPAFPSASTLPTRCLCRWR